MWRRYNPAINTRRACQELANPIDHLDHGVLLVRIEIEGLVEVAIDVGDAIGSLHDKLFRRLPVQFRDERIDVGRREGLQEHPIGAPQLDDRRHVRRMSIFGARASHRPFAQHHRAMARAGLDRRSKVNKGMLRDFDVTDLQVDERCTSAGSGFHAPSIRCTVRR